MDEFWNGDGNWPGIRLPLELSPQVVHVIRIRLDLPLEEWGKLTVLLTDEEHERANRFRFEKPRRCFVTCRATLRRLLGHACGVAPKEVPLQYGVHGKPGLAFADLDANTPKIEFSVSHSGNLGLIAMTLGSQVGVDVEEFDPKVKILKLAERFFSPSEAEELRCLAVEKQLPGFYRGWTCKEAYIKATGRGLSLPLNHFCVTIDPDQPALLRHVDGQPDAPLQWTARSLEVAPDFAAAVMVAQPNCQIQLWDWPVV